MIYKITRTTEDCLADSDSFVHLVNLVNPFY
jgi:hypothetical protein